MPINTRKNKDGTISYIPVVNYRLDGKSKKIYGETQSTLKEAKLELKRIEFEYENNRRNGVYDEQIEASKNKNSKSKKNDKRSITWDELFEMYMDYKKSQDLSYSHIRTLRTRYEFYFKPDYGSKKVCDMTVQDAIQFRTKLREIDLSDVVNNRSGKLNPKTINMIAAIPKEMIKIAKEIFGIEFKDPFTYKRLKLIEYKSNFYTDKDFAKYIHGVKNITDRILFIMLFSTGLRVGEATALTYADVIGKDGTILIDKTRKNAKDHDGRNSIGRPKTEASIRTIYIDKELEAMIVDKYEKLIEDNPKADMTWYVFGAKKPISFSTIRRHNEKYAKVAGLPVLRIHDFRGSFTTNCFTYTSNINVVSKLLGHTNTATTTKYYLKSKESDKVDLINQVNSNRSYEMRI